MKRIVNKVAEDNRYALYKKLIKICEERIAEEPEQKVIDLNNECITIFKNEMKRITNHKEKGNTRTVKNLCKKGFNNDRVIAYKRDNPVGLEEYAFLRRVSSTAVGFVSLIGGATYSPVYVHDNYCSCVAMAANQRELYEFKNLQEFLDNKHLMA